MNQLQMTLQVRAGVRNTIYVLWMQKSQAMTLYNPPQHLNSQSAHWYPHWRQTRKPIELFYVFLFFFFLYIFILFSVYSSLFLPAQADKLYQQIQLSNARPPCIQPETNFCRQQWKRKKKKIRTVLWGEIEGQNVNFPGNPSLVDWIVKRSSNAHFNTR